MSTAAARKKFGPSFVAPRVIVKTTSRRPSGSGPGLFSGSGGLDALSATTGGESNFLQGFANERIMGNFAKTITIGEGIGGRIMFFMKIFL